MMQPKLGRQDEKQTAPEFPDGIAAYATDALRFTQLLRWASTARYQVRYGRVEGYRKLLQQDLERARYG